jgi:hypothetical protein
VSVCSSNLETFKLTVFRFAANQQIIEESCDTWEVARNTEEETSAIHESIIDIANATGVDSRFILATIMQTSDGCVRATTTHPNFLAAGLMQRYACDLSRPYTPTTY